MTCADDDAERSDEVGAPPLAGESGAVMGGVVIWGRVKPVRLMGSMVSGGVVMGGVVIWGRVKPVRLMGSMVSGGVVMGGVVICHLGEAARRPKTQRCQRRRDGDRGDPPR